MFLATPTDAGSHVFNADSILTAKMAGYYVHGYNDTVWFVSERNPTLARPVILFHFDASCTLERVTEIRKPMLFSSASGDEEIYATGSCTNSTNRGSKPRTPGMNCPTATATPTTPVAPVSDVAAAAIARSRTSNRTGATTGSPTGLPEAPTHRVPTECEPDPVAVAPIVQSRTGYRIAGAAKGKVHLKQSCGSLKNKVVEEMVVTGTTDLCKKCYYEPEVVEVSVEYADIEAMLAELPESATPMSVTREPM
ncbi:hypothetical protein SARC_00608 [Sphaeroforma arctica JP610]|uniref:Uncharacterized protein n=1 Tax=Sphaeroforma arctica JP610 TaxID=667725 RepID=A0A0L0GE45_9EUKA|nr:hypothetical protein SARC_00608 [Sphaeroforma arctica JP610]KNC87280.1 hypothetical protein SARC_00608 [Sphaeroforma arctica JP610]|eukprot:XP_014161182.1 hypothetical protein SARC_00608 [Sphaeroforma arctica JP610]